MTTSLWDDPASSVAELGRRLQAQRGRRSVSDIAPLIPVVRNTLYRWENGDRLLALEYADRLDEIYGTGAGIRSSVLHLTQAPKVTTASHTWPAEYGGPVWIRLTGLLPAANYDVTIRWGVWLHTSIVRAQQDTVVLTTGKDPDAGTSHQVFAQVRPPAGIEFGSGTPPEGHQFDIRPHWDWKPE